jgi:uncharacterized protein YbjT (DUF2867 family)
VTSNVKSLSSQAVAAFTDMELIMKLLILGATGATGRLVVDQALLADHSVRALVRSPGKLTGSRSALEVITGQATNPDDVARAMSGVDVVISTLGANGGTVMADATRAIIAGAAAGGAHRVVMLSSFAVARDRLSRPAKLMSSLAMAAAIKDKTAAEDLLRASDLEWMIGHSVRLTNGPSIGAAKALPDGTRLGLGDTVARADVATWLLAAATDQFRGTRTVAIAA